jgi:uncharacterized protein (DUF1697 family)
MPRFFAFLRAINVGGHTVTMDALRGHFESLGLKDVETFIASGNVIFTTRSVNAIALEAKIEKRLRTSLGYEVKTFLRTEPELAAVARYEPFNASQVASAASRNVGFLAEPLGKEAIDALMALKTGVDDFHVHGREVYWLCKVGQGQSRFSNTVFERKVKSNVTFRGVNTVAKLAARYASHS